MCGTPRAGSIAASERRRATGEMRSRLRQSSLRISAPVRAARGDRPADRRGSCGRSRAGRWRESECRSAFVRGAASVTTGFLQAQEAWVPLAEPAPFWHGQWSASRDRWLAVRARPRRDVGRGGGPHGGRLRGDRRRRERAGVAHRLLGELQVVFERPVRRDAQLAEDGVIGLDGLDRADLAVDDQAEELDEGELVLGVVDLAAEEGDPGAVLLGLGQQLEGVARRARPSRRGCRRPGAGRTGPAPPCAFGPW